MKVSKYWELNNKTLNDRVKGKTFERSGGSLGCAECCNGDRCETPYECYTRECCPFCLGTNDLDGVE